MVLMNWSKLSSIAADIVDILTSWFYEGNSIGDVIDWRANAVMCDMTL